MIQKRFFLAMITLLIFIAHAQAAVAYSPAVSFGSSVDIITFDRVTDPRGDVRFSAVGNAKLDILAFSNGKNRFSLPIEAGLYSDSNTANRRFVPFRYRFSLGLQYERAINNRLALATQFGAGYTFYPNNNATGAFIFGELSTTYLFSNMIGLTVPVRVRFAKQEFNAEIGVAASVYFNGIIKEGNK